MSRIDGQTIILRVLSFDDQGRPDTCQVGYEDTKFDLRVGSREFRVVRVIDPDGDRPFAADPSKIGTVPIGVKQ